MMKSSRLYHMVLAGVLCAVGIVVPMFMPRIVLGPMSFSGLSPGRKRQRPRCGFVHRSGVLLYETGAANRLLCLSVPPNSSLYCTV